ncbi:hypothetical protein HN588_05740 [Candidatus Bathyarchaeota archaeon]|jgi:hypothetical protein|nr:hypothetical protein [Candidatus Bathyarchaeota archaeon]
MKRMKTVTVELTDEDVQRAVLALVGHKFPDLKEHLKTNSARLDVSGEFHDGQFTLVIDGMMTDASPDE